MRKLFGIACYIASGFFVYMVCLLAFISQPSLKWAMMAGFSMPAFFCLAAGLAANRFQHWRRDSGIVVLSGVGFTSLMALCFVCMVMTDEMKPMMKPETIEFFGAYAVGFGFLAGMGLLGGFLLTAGKVRDGGEG